MHHASWASRHPVAGRLALAGATLLASGCGGSSDADAPLEIRTLGNRADMVSAGDALLEIVLPEKAAVGSLRVQAGDRDVSAAFAVRANGRLMGLVDGLQDGDTTVTASADGARSARLTITNHPASGPIYSGPHSQPLYCATPVPLPASGSAPATNASGLSGQPSADCGIAAEFKLYYRTTTSGCTGDLPDPSPAVPVASTAPPAPVPAPANACFKPYLPGSTPADMATATTDAGVTVPFIVRVERGTRNRAIYDLAVLYEPGRPWSALAPQPAWNGKLFISFGGSTGQPKRQSRPATNWTSTDTENAIRRGFLVATSNHFDGARNSDRVVMSETIMMLREHVADTYGPVDRTIGFGASGGAITQGILNTFYPGLLDGSITSAAYPDQESVLLTSGDCTLLVEAFQKPAWLQLMDGKPQQESDAKKTAISGLRDPSSCHSFMSVGSAQRTAAPGLYFLRTASGNGEITQPAVPSNNCELPNAAVYDPSQPAATRHLPRCDMFSLMKNVYGVDPASGSGRHTRDNVGVQYGLKALQSGAITAEEFVTLNEIIGGLDRDLRLQPIRTSADQDALAIAYRVGTMSSGRNLAKLPIIDLRGWNDSLVNLPPGAPQVGYAFHFVYYSYAIQDRLDQGVGRHDSRAMWRFARTQIAPPGPMAGEALTTMDSWITGVRQNPGARSLEEQVRFARPASARDFCLLPQDALQASKVYDPAVCDADPYLTPSLSPRQVAGGPRADNVLKCQLKPLATTDYGAVALTAGQRARLETAFPAGVCDWSKPGVGQQDPAGPLSFRNGPGGESFGAAPASAPL